MASVSEDKQAEIIQTVSLTSRYILDDPFFEGILNRLYPSGPRCSKLTTSLVNVSLIFQTLISQICQYFLLKKCEKLLQCKSFSHFSNKKYQWFGYKVVNHFTR